MQDLVNTLMLICASIASLGAGLVLAYLTCKMGFAALKMQTRPATLQPAKAQVAPRIS